MGIKGKGGIGNNCLIKKRLDHWEYVKIWKQDWEGNDILTFPSYSVHKENSKHPMSSLFNLCNYCVFVRYPMTHEF